MRMLNRFTVGMTIVSLLAFVSSGLAAPTQLLLNPSFENGPASPLLLCDEPDNWSLSADFDSDADDIPDCSHLTYADPTKVPNPSGLTARTGDRFLMDVSVGNLDWGTAEQTVSLSGTVDLMLSFWARIDDNSLWPTSATGEIIVDGEVVAGASLSKANVGLGNTYQQVVATWRGTVVSEVTVRITAISDATGGGNQGHVAVDDVELWSSDCGTVINPTDISPNVVPFVSVPATATITISGDVADGDTLELDTGGVNRVYEFDTNSVSENGGDILLDVSADQSKGAAKAVLITVIMSDVDNVPFTIADGAGDDATLTWKTNGGGGATNTNLNDTNGSIAVTNFSVAAQPATTLTITGNNLVGGTVSAASLRRAGPGNQGQIIPGTNLTASGSDLEVDFVLDGVNPGFFDLVLDQAGCNSRVIDGAVNILDTSVSPNLLINSGFEVPDNKGNAQIWGGDYLTYSTAFADGARVHTPTPNHVDGLRAWEISDGSGSLKVVGAEQTVAVASGDAVSFTGWAHAKGGTTATVSINLWDGLAGTGVLLGTAMVTEATPPTGPEPGDSWVEVNLGGTANSGLVTVEFEASVQGTGNPAAVHLDAFRLTTSPVCATPQYPLFAYPSTQTHLQNVTVTILGGTNLDLITDVNLIMVDTPAVGDEPEIVIPGILGMQTPTSMDVTFQLGTEAAAEGIYNLVVEQESCPAGNLAYARVTRFTAPPPIQPNVPASFIDFFKVECENPIAFSGTSPDRAVAPQNNVAITITGSNLDEIDTISLVLGNTEVAGIINNQSAGQIDAIFVFTGQPFGSYTLVGTRADGLCNAPEPLPVAFTLLNGENLLLNGSFEADVCPGTDCQLTACAPDAETVTGWRKKPNDNPPTPDGSGCPKVNGSTHIPNPGAQDGVNRGSLDVGTGAGVSVHAYQTRLVLPDKPLQLSGWFIGASNTDVIYDHHIRLRDGGPTGPIIGSYGQPSSVTTWGFIDVTSPAPTTNTVTVEWGHSDGSGWGIFATHVDDLVLIQTPAICHNPKVDIDGDGDVDGEDFGLWQQCFTGTGNGVPAEPAYCFCLDISADHPGGNGDIAQPDLQTFHGCASGPGIPADPACDDFE